MQKLSAFHKHFEWMSFVIAEKTNHKSFAGYSLKFLDTNWWVYFSLSEYYFQCEYEPRRDPHFRGPRAWPEDRRHHRSPRRDHGSQTFHLPAPQATHELHESAIVPKEVKLSMSLDDVIAADIKKGRKYEVTRNSVLEMTKKDWKKLGFKDFMVTI